ncbi:MAG: type II toxin-antitoxin system PemK/MazF family toxin, partial [Bacteroidota bacterium]
MKQGTIVLVPFPFTDQPAKSKRRPAIIISNQSLNSIGDIIVAAVTSQ